MIIAGHAPSFGSRRDPFRGDFFFYDLGVSFFSAARLVNRGYFRTMKYQYYAME